MRKLNGDRDANSRPRLRNGVDKLTLPLLLVAAPHKDAPARLKLPVR